MTRLKRLRKQAELNYWLLRQCDSQYMPLLVGTILFWPVCNVSLFSEYPGLPDIKQIGTHKHSMLQPMKHADQLHQLRSYQCVHQKALPSFEKSSLTSRAVRKHVYFLEMQFNYGDGLEPGRISRQTPNQLLYNQQRIHTLQTYTQKINLQCRIGADCRFIKIE